MRTRAFADRAEAGRRLAGALASYRGRNPLVLAIPRGGVPIGRIIADALDGELDIVLVRKLGAPFNPELAIGAVDERGTVHLMDYAHRAHANAAFVEKEAARELELIRKRRREYSPQRAPIDPAGRIVIVVDDGLATGATMRAALLSVRARHPERVVCAIPVAAPESLRGIEDLCDDVVCLDAPRDFQAVGQFYVNFLPVSDADVVSLLSAEARTPPASAPAGARHVRIALDDVDIEGDLQVPAAAGGLVIFAHGSGSGRMSPRNRSVARVLNEKGLATLLCDLLTAEEDEDRSRRFDIALLADRVEGVVTWAVREPSLRSLPVGLFGASTGAAAALIAAVRRPDAVKAVVSRGGRPDLAGTSVLERVAAPTLLIVGGADTEVVAINRIALSRMSDAARLIVVPGATHLFEEPGALERVAALAAHWFDRYLSNGHAALARPARGRPGPG
jgi:putative phosphoribosyl transferase